ncbi:hypothetical protein JYG23_12710 [Sedimentibacter sp. zth1]|uniref:hypothetical protein n=1 Tax=Sedimentibacter sp. zth1 TaxID=2816908 RepID=UPI001A925512|nr:hypothetical protein [Sedimentibacter sp. zth1]QSX05524.1 hypothetical protein JYG23_12710 [Sedimentibacter sp. zth1]
MIKLIKYEFIKKSKLFLILLVSSILANVALGLIYDMSGIAIFLGLSPIILGILYIYELIKTYSDALNKNTGYMTFMTPNSGYKIIGSKLLFTLLVGLIFFIGYIMFVGVNGLIIVIRNFPLGQLKEGFTTLLIELNEVAKQLLNMNIGDVLLFVLMILVSSIVFTLTVYSSITIRKSLFSNTKYGGVLSFIIFIVLNLIIGKLGELLSRGVNLDYTIQQINISNNINITYPSKYMFTLFMVMIVYNAVVSLVLMISSGYLLEHKINL